MYIKMAGFAFLLGAGQSSAANEILNFQFGNQIAGSYLTIDDSGVVRRAERHCCPPRTEQMPEQILTQETTAQLLEDIAMAATAPQSESYAGSSAQGSKAGFLHVKTANGTMINVRTIARGSTETSQRHVTFSDCNEARRIEQLVFSMADVDMDLDRD